MSSASENSSCDISPRASKERSPVFNESSVRSLTQDVASGMRMDVGNGAPPPAKGLIRGRRTKSLYGACPSANFGPKGCLMKNSTTLTTCPFSSCNKCVRIKERESSETAILYESMEQECTSWEYALAVLAVQSTIQDPAGQRLTWYKKPVSVLIIKKILDENIIQPFKELVLWLVKEKEMSVFVEAKVLDEPTLKQDCDFQKLQESLQTFCEDQDDLTNRIDFIICLGGDGTLLYASSLFQQSVPPVLAFHLGSLGFLTPFQFENFREHVTSVIAGNVPLTLRSRLKCTVWKKHSDSPKLAHINEIQHEEKRKHILVLNEVVVDRGPSPYLCNVDLYIEKNLVTSVQGDGLIISTPTGSTAYAAAAGASMIHPNVPAIVITPICPHSLSFRPIVVPAGVEVTIMVSPAARHTAWASFDGRNRQELSLGDTLRITTSIYPVPSICSRDQINDWFDGLAECLHWNVRKSQKQLSSSVSTASLDSLAEQSDRDM